ncbi:hypothetical protein MRX96_034210 [Rhipicephalus microplus]
MATITHNALGCRGSKPPAHAALRSCFSSPDSLRKSMAAGLPSRATAGSPPPLHDIRHNELQTCKWPNTEIKRPRSKYSDILQDYAFSRLRFQDDDVIVS